jgi:hypothetical protein
VASLGHQAAARAKAEGAHRVETRGRHAGANG